MDKLIPINAAATEVEETPTNNDPPSSPTLSPDTLKNMKSTIAFVLLVGLLVLCIINYNYGGGGGGGGLVSAAAATTTFTSRSDENTPALSVDIIKTIRRSGKWQAGVNKRFVGKTVADVKKMLGLTGLKPIVRYSDDELKLLEEYYLAKKGMSSALLPDSFDSREKWPTCIHPIRNQVCIGLIGLIGFTNE